MKSDEREELVKTLRGIAGELGTDSVSMPEFLRRSGVSEWKIQRCFGSYNGLVEAAGLVPRRFAFAYSDDDMLDEIVRVLRLPASKLTTLFFEQQSKISSSACKRRFGGWLNALKATAARLDPVGDATLLTRIQEYTAPAISPQSDLESIATDAEVAEGHADEEEADAVAVVDRSAPVEGGNIYGDFINFRGLQHAPVNEQGVVFLFGMICRELGYVVEIVKQGFPDCEAKRQVRPGLWQRVRIEFEFRSRSFRLHGHDPDQCDVIVCWEDNWPDCPVEVLELKAALQRLSPTLKAP